MTSSAKNKDLLSWSPGRYHKQRRWVCVDFILSVLIIMNSICTLQSIYAPATEKNLNIFLKWTPPQPQKKNYIFSSYLLLPTTVSVDPSYLNTCPVQPNLRVSVYMELTCIWKFACFQIFLTSRYTDEHLFLNRKPSTDASLISLCP